MNRETATQKILEAKREKGLTYEAIAGEAGRHKVWTTAALHGQHPMTVEQANAVCSLLGLDAEVASVLQEIPMRGSFDGAPLDPTMYRLYEVLQVYGPSMKALINEEFGDGIMSAIGFDMDIEREEDPEGDRVRITLSGKFLPYNWREK